VGALGVAVAAGDQPTAGSHRGPRAGRTRQVHHRPDPSAFALLGSMPDALVIVNAEGKIVGSNAHTEKLFGYSDRELQGESMASGVCI